MKRQTFAVAALLALSSLSVLGGCGKKPESAPSTSTSDASVAEKKEELRDVHESFRHFVGTAYPLHDAPPGKPDARQCALQNAVMMRPGPPRHWVGQLAGPIRDEGKSVNIRVTFNRGDDGSWQCDPANSQMMTPGTAPASDGDAGSTDACAYLASHCGPAN